MKLKIFIFLFFSLVLLIPVIQRDIHIFRVRHLNGSFVSVEKPTFNFTAWMQGSFQDSIEPYLKDNIGMENFIIRINNQIDFSLFNETNSKNTIIGKSGYLFDEPYIFVYRGDDFKGKNILSKRIKKLKFIKIDFKIWEFI